jgi:DNA-binding NarL/FixJ family response regulator
MERFKDIKFTDREWEIIYLLAKGLNNQEIADTIFISVHTVKANLENIYRKLDLHNRVQVVLLLFRLGLLEIDKFI